MKRLPVVITNFVIASIALLCPLFAEDSVNPPSHYNELKQLEWMIGNWIDSSADIDYNIRWDGNKNFINQYFNVKKDGKEDLYGDQLIGWDPSQNQLKSWIFDSDGGFGHSIWHRDGDTTWYAITSFTKPDGSKVSATHIYTKIDNDTYTFASVARESDGAILPNIGPFKIVRKK